MTKLLTIDVQSPKGQIFVKCNDNMDIDKAIESIAQIILSFIL